MAVRILGRLPKCVPKCTPGTTAAGCSNASVLEQTPEPGLECGGNFPQPACPDVSITFDISRELVSFSMTNPGTGMSGPPNGTVATTFTFTSDDGYTAQSHTVTFVVRDPAGGCEQTFTWSFQTDAPT